MRKNLIQARKAKKLTQKQLAKKLDITERSYQKYESGECDPKFKNLFKLEDILEISARTLMIDENK